MLKRHLVTFCGALLCGFLIACDQQSAKPPNLQGYLVNDPSIYGNRGSQWGMNFRPGGGQGHAGPVCNFNNAAKGLLYNAPSGAQYTNFGGVGGSFRMDFCFQLLGDPVAIEDLKKSNRVPHENYYGPLRIFGTLTVTGAATIGSCVIPAGSYRLLTKTDGSYDSVGFEVPEIEAFNSAIKLNLRIQRGWPRDVNVDRVNERVSVRLHVESTQQPGKEEYNCNDYQGLFFN